MTCWIILLCALFPSQILVRNNHLISLTSHLYLISVYLVCSCLVQQNMKFFNFFLRTKNRFFCKYKIENESGGSEFDSIICISRYRAIDLDLNTMTKRKNLKECCTLSIIHCQKNHFLLHTVNYTFENVHHASEKFLNGAAFITAGSQISELY